MVTTKTPIANETKELLVIGGMSENPIETRGIQHWDIIDFLDNQTSYDPSN